MEERGRAVVQLLRLRKALAAVGALFAVLAFACAVEAGCLSGVLAGVFGASWESSANADQAGSASHVGKAFALMMDDADPGSVALASALGFDSSGVVPAWFAEELFALSDMREVMANDAWTVVGFTLTGSAEQAFDEVSSRLAEKGWQGLESGVSGITTFFKEGGAVQWVMVSCTQVGEETSVVLRLSHI